MIARADAALYQAKRRGRNRVATEQDFSKSVFIASAEIEAACGPSPPSLYSGLS